MGPAFYSINRCAVRVPCQFAQMLTHREGDQVVMGINHFGINARVMLHTQGCKWFGRAAGVCFKADLAKRFPAVKAFAWGIEPRNERGRPFGASSKGRFQASYLQASETNRYDAVALFAHDTVGICSLFYLFIGLHPPQLVQDFVWGTR